MTERRSPPGVSKGVKAKCVFCGHVFYKSPSDYDERCWGCRADSAPMTLARRSAEEDCAMCGTAVVLTEGVLTHLDPERDDYHKAL